MKRLEYILECCTLVRYVCKKLLGIIITVPGKETAWSDASQHPLLIFPGGALEVHHASPVGIAMPPGTSHGGKGSTQSGPAQLDSPPA
mmetsp:Transcript_53940/g.161447  ORF Transcript_53940/g.161447 Transcript_53940/m.161447 type:complete len:88 (+) Transcript_53940:34-297(+)